MDQCKRMLEEAIEIATKAHEGQTRKFNGEPYINHPKRVAGNVEMITRNLGIFDFTYQLLSLQMAAWLHDVIEDTSVTLEDLKAQDIPWHVINTVDILTKRENENYLDFILRIKQNRFACIVKIADINDNMSDLKEGSLKDKYRLAKHILEGALDIA